MAASLSRGHCSLEMYRRSFRCKVCEKTYDKDDLIDMTDPRQRRVVE